MTATITRIAKLSAFLYSGIIGLLVLASPKYSAFSVHPIAMALALSSMLTAILSFDKKTGARKDKKETHISFVICTFVFLIIGFVAILVAHKGLHFRSIHSKTGIVALLCAFMQVLSGYAASKYRVRWLWRLHHMSGIATFLMMAGVSLLNILPNRSWIAKHFEPDIANAAITILGISIVGMLAAIASKPKYWIRK